MNEQKIQVFQKTAQLFFKNGIKGVTMDDVARELGISKKTLYKHVKDKSDLVQQVISLSLEQDRQAFEFVFEEKGNAIDQLFEVTRIVKEKLSNFHPSIHYDLRKYHPEAWEVFTRHKSEFIYACMARNMEKGIAEGLYRENLSIPVIARIYISRMEDVFNAEIFPPDQFHFAEVYLEMIRYHVRGIASEKGIRYLTGKIKKMQTHLL